MGSWLYHGRTFTASKITVTISFVVYMDALSGSISTRRY